MTDRQITIYTLGHGTRTGREFIALLTAFGITCLIDVRRFPGSRRHPHFSGEALRESLAAAGIQYRWAGDTLGGQRKSAPGSPHTALRVAGFRAYADHMETAEFSAAALHLLDMARDRPTAVMCAE